MLKSETYTGKSWCCILLAIANSEFYNRGTWGVDIYDGLGPDVSKGDVVVSKHWSSR